MRLNATVLVAGVVDGNGVSYTADALRQMAAQTEGMRFDEARNALVYDGPVPPVRRCPCGEMTINDCAGECGRPGSDKR